MTWDFIAGFTDGEGSLGICGRGPRVTWGQNDKRVLIAIRAFLEQDGFHCNWNVIAPKPPRRPNAIHMLSISRRADCARIAEILRPRVIVKADACDRLLAWLKTHPAQKNFGEPDEAEVRSLIAQGCDWPELGKRLNFGKHKLRAFCLNHDIPSPAATRRARQAFYEESLSTP